MNIALNYRKGNARLREGIEAAGHAVTENVWDMPRFIDEGIDAAVFEFRHIFRKKWEFLPLAYQLKSHRIPAVTWNIDSPWNLGIKGWKVNLLLKSRLLTLYATHSCQDTEWIKDTKVIYLPNAAWTSRYNLHGATLEELRRPDRYRWDVSFIGNLDKQRYPEHSKRVEFLGLLGNVLKEKGVHFLFVDGKDIPVGEQVGIIQKSRINLSCISAADSFRGFSWGIPERCYGIPACGGFLLMEERVHVKHDFRIGEEVVTYAGHEDCIRKILSYRERHDERRRIAEKAYHRVMREHTYTHRALRLIAEIQGQGNDVIEKCD